MADSQNKGAGAVDIVSSVLNAGAVIFGTINANKQGRNRRLPDWLSPKDFQRKDYTFEIIIGVIVIIILTLMTVIALKRN
jgi:hypothetical protein